MIIDAHGHVSLPPEAYQYQAQLIASSGNPHSGPPKISEERQLIGMERTIKAIDAAGTDIQLVSPRPYHLMHSLGPRNIVEKWTRFVNDQIAENVRLKPDRFIGVGGLPQFRTEDLSECVRELERCVTQLGFVGCLLNPDPLEGGGTPPGLASKYWYPLYEKFCELDVPLHVHSAGCTSPRESYTLHFINEESIAVIELLESSVFDDFPTLKVLMSHGGGAIPYHAGRFRSWSVRQGGRDFDESLRLLRYDTCVYSEEGLDLLLNVVGADRVLFGTEAPGTGAAMDPKSGRQFDDMLPLVRASARLTEAQKTDVLSQNAIEFFGLKSLVQRKVG